MSKAASDVLAIIPARGGSKGIPRKNVRMLRGRPLIAHSIEQALLAPSVTRVVVSTDDAEIADVAEHYGAEVVWRPAEISGDMASSEEALLHVLGYLQSTEEYNPDLVVFLQCTSPLTMADDIEGTIIALIDDDADTALAAVLFHYFLWRDDESGDAIGINHDKSRRLLRQERDSQFLEAGAVYAMRTPGFLEARHRFFGKTALYIMPNERLLEIDEEIDLHIAEALMAESWQEQQVDLLPDLIEAVVFDFDGVFTDNRVVVSEDGRESVICNRSDGLRLSHLKQQNIPLLVLSSEANPVVKARCSKLDIPCIHGCIDKISALNDWVSEHHIDLSKVVYVGNDSNDLACLQEVGCSVVVNDAHPDVRSAAQIVLSATGGHGAVREICDLILCKTKADENANNS